MGTSVDKGLPLFPAIRTFSDPVAWAELENLLSVKVDPAEKGRWTPNDWAKHDFSIKLLLGLALPGSGSAVRLKNLQGWHRWVILRTGFHKRLQSGELVARGYVKPAKIDDHHAAIAPDKWGFLEPDFRDSTASGGGLEIVDVLVYPAESADVSQPRVSHAPPVTQRRRGGPRPGNYIVPLNNFLEFLFKKQGELKFFERKTLKDIRLMVHKYFARSENLRYHLPKSRSQLEKRIKEFVARKRRETPS